MKIRQKLENKEMEESTIVLIEENENIQERIINSKNNNLESTKDRLECYFGKSQEIIKWISLDHVQEKFTLVTYTPITLRNKEVKLEDHGKLEIEYTDKKTLNYRITSPSKKVFGVPVEKTVSQVKTKHFNDVDGNYKLASKIFEEFLDAMNKWEKQ